MKRLSLLLAILAALGSTRADPCGDKFLRVGRGARYQRGYAALYPARIILYNRPSSAASGTLRELEPVLRRAGHKLITVEGTQALGPALRTGRFDVILSDYAEVATVEKQVGSGGPPPAIIPVLLRPTKEALAAAEKAYPCVVEAPGKRSDVLERIDALMEALRKAEGASKK